MSIGKITYFFVFLFKKVKKSPNPGKKKAAIAMAAFSPLLEKHYSFTSVCSAGASAAASALGAAFLELRRVLLALAGF